MIVTVTPNAAIDKTYTVESFGLDRVHRPSDSKTVAGGKGINVSRVLSELGRESIATGFAGGLIGEAVLRNLAHEGLQYDFVKVREESRLCIAIMDPVSGTQTEVNENGPLVSESEVSTLIDKTVSLVENADYVVLSGSCPPGVPVDFYAEITRRANNKGVRVVLDTSGDNLREGIKAAPFIVKPNAVELSQLVGRELFTLEEIARAARNSLRDYGVTITAVTMGKSGAMVTDGEQAWIAVPPHIDFASAVGSGDAFVAAFIDSLMRGEQLPDALKWGVAAGAANATSYGAGFCSKDSIIDMEKCVSVDCID